jgi:hypothetical protein
MSLTDLFTELKRHIDEDGIPSTSKTAILWGREDLLGSAIESILNTTRVWQVINLLGSHDAKLLAREVEKASPKIVFINQGDSTDEFPPPLHLIQDLPDLKIIVINLDNNLVEVYKKQGIWIKEASELMSIVDEHPTSNPGGGEHKR